MYIPAGFRIDAICIRRRNIINRNSFDSHIITEFRVYSPERGIDNFHSLNLYLLTTNRLNERRTEKTSLQCAYIILICFSINGRSIILCIPHRLIFIQIMHTVIFQVNHDPEKLHPPFFTLSVQSSFALDRNILCIHCID